VRENEKLYPDARNVTNKVTRYVKKVDSLTNFDRI